MVSPKLGTSSTGRRMHYSVGALIEQNSRYLLIDRSHIPFGFAGPAGHVDEGETPKRALKREVKEETGLIVKGMGLLLEEEVHRNKCSHGADVHYWRVYACNATGNMQGNKRETKSIGWYSKEEIKKLKLEKVWKYWFRRLKII